MVKIIYKNNSEIVHGNDVYEKPELRLVRACYTDDANEVRYLIDKFSDIDVNAIVISSPTKGNGTPLILTGKQEIAQLLLEKGADVNLVYDTGTAKITALDSAYKELEKNHSATIHQEIEDLIAFLEQNHAKKFGDLGDSQ